MRKIIINQDILAHCIKANSFPDGVLEAFQKLHSLIDFPQERRSFGISRKENEMIVYWAAAEAREQEDLKTTELTKFIIPKGVYISIEIKNIGDNFSLIKKAFDQLKLHAQIEPKGYCIEEYINMDEVICMMRISD